MCFIGKKESNDFIKAVNKYSKVDHCLLCGKKMEFACNSHVVPQFILREIAENGKVSYGYSLSPITVAGIEKTTGINNAHTFRLICRSCDQKTFSHYENPENILNFDKLDLNLQKKIFCEMAIKTHLSHISMKYRKLVSMDIAKHGELAKMEQDGKIVIAERLDINEHLNYIDKLKRTCKSNKNPFYVIFNKVLNYKTKLSTQTIINFNYDLTGKNIFDPYNLSTANECRYFYLMIILCKDETRVLFYIEKANTIYIKDLIAQFNELSDEDMLHLLFVSLIINDQQFYMSPSFANLIFKKDKAIVKLYSKSEKDYRYESEIGNFKKYRNYLVKEYNN